MWGILRFCKVGVGGFAMKLVGGFGQFKKIWENSVTFCVESYLNDVER